MVRISSIVSKKQDVIALARLVVMLAICSISNAFAVEGAQSLPKKISPEVIDGIIAKARGMEVLFASESTSNVASVAGHLMLRVKMDASSDDYSAAQNGRDYVFAIVAQMPEKVSPQALFGKGIFGGFAPIAQVQYLGDVVRRYTVGEERDLYRYKLLISREEQAALLKQLLTFNDRKQSFGDSYRFFDRNCATLMVMEIAKASGDEELLKSLTLIEAPNFALGKLKLAQKLEPVQPGFYSESRKLSILRAQREMVVQKALASAPSEFFSVVPKELLEKPLRALSEEKRIVLYKSLVDAAHQADEMAPAIEQILLVSQAEEKAITREEFRKKTPKAPPTVNPLASSAENALLTALFQMHDVESLKGHFSELSRQSEAGMLYEAEERRQHAVGSAHVGLFPVSAGSGYVVWNNRGRLELEISAAAYQQKFGDPSGYDLGDRVSMQLLPMSITIALEPTAIERWHAAFMEFATLRAGNESLDSDESKRRLSSIFTNDKLGFRLKILDFLGDHTRSEALEAHWAQAEVLANIIASEGFRSYLVASVGLSVGRTWALRSNELGLGTRNFISAPVSIEGHYSFQNSQATELRAALVAEPKISRLKDFEIESYARLTLSQLLGVLWGTEWRLQTTAEYQPKKFNTGQNADVYRFIGTIEGRAH